MTLPAQEAIGLGGVNQTSFLFGALAFGFLFFITVRGDLPKWLGVFGLAGAATPGTAGGAIGSTLGNPAIAPLAALAPIGGSLAAGGVK